MRNINVKTHIVINPLFFIALNDLRARELPIPVLKQVRRIEKKFLEEMKEIQADTDIVIRDVFGTEFTREEVIILIRGGQDKFKEIFEELKFPPEKQESYLKRAAIFDQKSKELGDQVIEIPFPKVVLPEDFKFRTDYATILEDVIELD